LIDAARQNRAEPDRKTPATCKTGAGVVLFAGRGTQCATRIRATLEKPSGQTDAQFSNIVA